MTYTKGKQHGMSPRSRFLSGIFGGRVDRPPVGNVVSIATQELMEATDAWFPEAHLDAETMARLAAGGHELLGFDTVEPYFSVVQEAAALGCEIDWGGPDTMPASVTHPWSTASDYELPPDFLDHPAIDCLLQAIAILRDRYQGRVAVVGKAFGPWTLGYEVYGLSEFLIKVILDPDDIRALIDCLAEVTICFAEAQFAAGADVVCIPDHVTGDLVGPDTYRDFLLPVHQRITADLGGPLILHCCGNTADRVAYFAEAGWECYHIESAVDPREARDIVGDRMSLMGNINNPETLLLGTPAEVKRACRDVWEAGYQILSPECAVPLQTPNANLKAIVDAAVELGRVDQGS
jgi:[methyl-Co(III) methanol-specific corrinoid protein]:coenzyme M methyltransferase